MFECLNTIKVQSGFSFNVKGIINVAEKKFQNLKSHDCHLLMTQLLRVALRGILPPNVRFATVKLCAFLNAICQANRMQVDYLSHKTQEPQGQVLFVFSLVTFSSRWSLVILFLVNSHLGLIFQTIAMPLVIYTAC
jgi:hypothetical protein